MRLNSYSGTSRSDWLTAVTAVDRLHARSTSRFSGPAQLVLTRRIGETLSLGHDIRVTALAVSGHESSSASPPRPRCRCTGRWRRSGQGRTVHKRELGNIA